MGLNRLGCPITNGIELTQDEAGMDGVHTVKTPDVEFRTYNRMTQDQTVH
jgi:hypothetical protein